MDKAKLMDIHGNKRIRCVAGAQYLHVDRGTTTTDWLYEISLIPNSAARLSARLMILRLEKWLAFEWQIGCREQEEALVDDILAEVVHWERRVATT